MNCVPAVKQFEATEGKFDFNNIRWNFCDDVDERVVAAAKRICDCQSGVNIVGVSHQNEDSEGYSITVESDKITIIGEGAKGAFYALSTLKMLIAEYDGIIPCCKIQDYPDMKIRGFYQDTTRGRIPTLETLKKLVDTMADYKLNMLQLYVEHTFDFKEYEFCREKLGYISTEEIKELDAYCKDRFIDLIPSLSCFGHLYHLLQSDRYKHLCELKDYEPTLHHFSERMKHHTINPLLEESFELIKSLIDQHMVAFTSEYFNICCDETFDLGTDVNADKDKGELYVGFVTKLIKYVESKGKKVMMWGDIVLEHPESAQNLPDSIIYLNWDYSRNPGEENVKALSEKNQLVCPGTSSWYGFSERIGLGSENIINLAKLGYKYNALGILNTNWGDRGNPASITMAMYGMILGGAVSWDKNASASDEFNSFVAKHYYGNDLAIEALKLFDEIEQQTHWSKLMLNSLDEDNTLEVYKEKMTKCEALINKIKNIGFKTDVIKEEFCTTAMGYALMIKWCAANQGFKVDTVVNFEEWLAQYKKNWYAESKKSELDAVGKCFISYNSK